jgi:hypothetical protein
VARMHVFFFELEIAWIAELHYLKYSFGSRSLINKNNGSLPTKYTIFHLILIYFKKIKKNQKIVGDHLAT